MTARTERLRRESLAASPSISSERASITTAFFSLPSAIRSISSEEA